MTVTFSAVDLPHAGNQTRSKRYETSERLIPDTASPSVVSTAGGATHITLNGELWSKDGDLEVQRNALEVLMDSAPHELVLHNGTTITCYMSSISFPEEVGRPDAMVWQAEFIATSLTAGYGDIIPASTCTEDLGTNTYRWRYLYSQYLNLQQTGTVKDNLDIVSLTNSGNAADMDATTTSILFNQYYYDAATPAIADSGRISVGTEQDWTSTASTQDSYLAFHTSLNGTVAEKVRITSGGLFGVGIIPTSLLHVATDTTAIGLAVLEQASADADSFDFEFRKTRGTVASPSVITTVDELGVINFLGYSGAAGYVIGAAIKAISEGTIGTTRVPAKLSFWTGTDAAPTVLTERMFINSAGYVCITLAGVPHYDNNAAAEGAGLSNGMLYRTDADPAVVCIVV